MDGVEVWVSVLGPVGIAGAARPFRRAWSLDLVVYLALHPNGASTDQWSTALWPDRLMAPSTLYSTASAARRSLGRRSAGGDHLPHGHGRLRLADSVGTDVRRLAELAERPDPAGWREGLTAVRGRPFAGLRSPDWTILEGFVAEIEDLVVRTALRLGEQRLAEGDGPGAAWAARRALLASPFDERLYRILLRAADLEGNPAGVESTMAELLLVFGEPAVGGPPARQFVGHRLPVHPETASLYRALSRHSTMPAPRSWGARL